MTEAVVNKATNPVTACGLDSNGKPKEIGVTGNATDGYSLNATSPAYSFVKYSGSGYTYWCEAAIGSARSSAVWRVARVTDATGDVIYAGTGLFEHAATDLSTVAALTYTLGV